MLFGASGGVFIFNPDSIRKSSYIPPIVFSKLTVANEDITPGSNSLLKVDIDDADKLVLRIKRIFSPFISRHSIIPIRKIYSMLIFSTDLKNSGPLPINSVA